MIKTTTLFALCASTVAFAQTYQSTSPIGKEMLISLEREYDQSQATLNEIAQQEYVYTTPNKDKLVEILGNTVSAGAVSTIQKETFEYDTQNRIIRTVLQEKNENGVLAITEEILYQYNTENNPTQITRNEYDESSDTFSQKEKYILSYNPSGKISQIQWYDDYDEVIVEDTFTYNNQNQVETFRRVNGDAETLEERTYQYANGVCTGYISQGLNSGSWGDNYKVEIEYDANNENIINETHYNYTNSAWVGSVRMEYQYNLQKLNERVYTHKNYLDYIGTNDWLTSKNIVTKNEQFTYDTITSEWKPTKTLAFEYINAQLSLVEANKQSVKMALYPNPTQDYFKIQSEKPLVGTIRLIDGAGRIVKTYNAKEKEFSVQGLEKGIYFVQTSQETLKLILK